MRIAYLLQTNRKYDEVVEMINQLVKQGDHVFIMINDNELRDEVGFVYVEHDRVHISKRQEYGDEMDMSLARGTVLQMVEALEMEDIEFDYFINLTDGMIPVKTRSEIVKFLEENDGKDFYYVAREEDEALLKRVSKYYCFTNLTKGYEKKINIFANKSFASFLSLIGVKRKLTDPYKIGSPWFILSRKSVTQLVQNFPYVSETYKLQWYPEELYIQMMMDKFVYTNGDASRHVNKDMRCVGPDGFWVEGKGARTLSEDVLNEHPDALFAGKITAEDNFDLFQKFFDKYNEEYDAMQTKEKVLIDPEIVLNALFKPKNKEE